MIVDIPPEKGEDDDVYRERRTKAFIEAIQAVLGPDAPLEEVPPDETTVGDPRGNARYRVRGYSTVIHCKWFLDGTRPGRPVNLFVADVIGTPWMDTNTFLGDIDINALVLVYWEIEQALQLRALLLDPEDQNILMVRNKRGTFNITSHFNICGLDLASAQRAIHILKKLREVFDGQLHDNGGRRLDSNGVPISNNGVE